MFISKIIYWHLNIDGVFSSASIDVTCSENEAYFVNKIKYIFRKMVSGILL